MQSVTTEIIIDGLTFPEAPRWRDGCLWFSDFYSESVFTLGLDGALEKQFEVPGRPSGLGWTPEGDILVVSMLDRKLMRYRGGELHEIVGLSDLAGGNCNDMVVAADGTAYVGNFGFDIHGNEDARAADLIRVSPSGSAEIVAEGLLFPNGSVISDDGGTLIVAETFGRCLTAFDLDKSGGLGRRRIWANLGEYCPDGICFDNDGAIWAATPGPGSASLIRVEESGRISHEIVLTQDAYACAMADDGHSLLVCTSAHFEPEQCKRNQSGRIEKIDTRKL